MALKDESNNWIHDAESLKGMVRSFFMGLYCEDHQHSPFPISGGFPRLDIIDWNFVYRPLSMEEIKNTLFAMGNLKAPGPCSIFSESIVFYWSVYL